jgi:hypothetical protein
MNRYHKVAARITKEHGVHVEYASANAEYVIEGHACRGSRQAERLAKQAATAANNYGVLGAIKK